jgi:hypothetical protein
MSWHDQMLFVGNKTHAGLWRPQYKIPSLEQVLTGIKALQAREPGSKMSARLPIVADLLLKMKQSWEGTDQDWDKSMLWAAVTMCFLGSGEITDGAFDEGAHLTFSDVAVDCIKNPQLLKIRLNSIMLFGQQFMRETIGARGSGHPWKQVMILLL